MGRSTVHEGRAPAVCDQAKGTLSSKAGAAGGDQAGGTEGPPWCGSTPPGLHSMGLPCCRALVWEEQLLSVPAGTQLPGTRRQRPCERLSGSRSVLLGTEKLPLLLPCAHDFHCRKSSQGA